MEECAAYCRNISPLCKWWSYQIEKNHQCQFYQTCPSIDEDQKSFVSGQASCGGKYF